MQGCQYQLSFHTRDILLKSTVMQFWTLITQAAIQKSVDNMISKELSDFAYANMTITVMHSNWKMKYVDYIKLVVKWLENIGQYSILTTYKFHYGTVKYEQHSVLTNYISMAPNVEDNISTEVRNH